jgi:hypothetical protein
VQSKGVGAPVARHDEQYCLGKKERKQYQSDGLDGQAVPNAVTPDRPCQSVSYCHSIVGTSSYVQQRHAAGVKTMLDRTSYILGPAYSRLLRKWYLRVIPLTHFFSSWRMSRNRVGSVSRSVRLGEGGQLQYCRVLTELPTTLNVIFTFYAL